jgi:hypothetical protein
VGFRGGGGGGGEVASIMGTWGYVCSGVGGGGHGVSVGGAAGTGGRGWCWQQARRRRPAVIIQ